MGPFYSFRPEGLLGACLHCLSVSGLVIQSKGQLFLSLSLSSVADAEVVVVVLEPWRWWWWYSFSFPPFLLICIGVGWGVLIIFITLFFMYNINADMLIIGFFFFFLQTCIRFFASKIHSMKLISKQLATFCWFSVSCFTHFSFSIPTLIS